MASQFIDITSWNLSEQGETGAMYGEGALSKFLLKGKKEQQWMFKETWHRTKNGYDEEIKHQYWSEIVAYLLSRYMKVYVPETHIGYYGNHPSGEISFFVGALSKWFVNDNTLFVCGSEILQNLFADKNKDYTEKGCTFQDSVYATAEFVASIQNDDTVSKEKRLVFEQWASMAIFDIVIGNTDRHHENWGILKSKEGSKLAPVYDNGVSLGFREKESDIDSCEKRDQVIKRLWKGYRYKYKAGPNKNKKVVDIICVLKKLNIDKKFLLSKLSGITAKNLQEIKNNVIILNKKLEQKAKDDNKLSAYVLSDNRLELMLGSIKYRACKLVDLINEIYL